MTQYNFYYRGDKELSKVLLMQDLGQLFIPSCINITKYRTLSSYTRKITAFTTCKYLKYISMDVKLKPCPNVSYMYPSLPL